MFLSGDGIRERDVRGQMVTDVNFLVCFNADAEDVEFTLPPAEYAPAWEIVVDTAGEGADAVPRPAGSLHTVTSRSLVVLRAYHSPETTPDHSVAASLAGLMTGTIPVIDPAHLVQP
jgi:glycogen operon protein